MKLTEMLNKMFLDDQKRPVIEKIWILTPEEAKAVNSERMFDINTENDVYACSLLGAMSLAVNDFIQNHEWNDSDDLAETLKQCVVVVLDISLLDTDIDVVVLSDELATFRCAIKDHIAEPRCFNYTLTKLRQYFDENLDSIVVSGLELQMIDDEFGETTVSAYNGEPMDSEE